MLDTDDVALARELARTRSHAALERLLERHWASVHRLALRALGDPAAADDVAQQAFLDLIGAGRRLEGVRELGPWLRTVVLNRVRKHQRSAARRRAHEERAAAWRPEAARGHRDEALDAERVAARVADLPEETRLPLVLHYYEGLSHAEVAEAVGCPKGTAASRIRRGLEQLQGALVGGAALALPDLEALLRETPGPTAPPLPSPAGLLERAGAAGVALSKGLLAALAGSAAVVVGLVGVLVVLAGAPSGPGPVARTAAPPAPPARSPAPRPPEPERAGAAPVATSTATSPATQASPAGRGEGGEPAPDAPNAAIELALVDDLGQPLRVPVRVWTTEFSSFQGGPMRPALNGRVESEWVDVPAGGRARLPLTVKAEAEVGFTVMLPPDLTRADDDAWEEGRDLPVGLPLRWYLFPPDGEGVPVAPGASAAVTRVVPRAARLAIRVTGLPPRTQTKFELEVHGDPVTEGQGQWLEPLRCVTPPGRGTFVVQAPGFVTARRELDLAPGEAAEVEIVMEPTSARALGQVVDVTDGRPVRGAKVTVGAHEALTGADGGFQLTMDEGRAEVAVQADGYCRTVVPLEGQLAPAATRIELQPAGTLELTVVDAAGAPVAGDLEVEGDPSRMPLLAHCDPTGRGAAREDLLAGWRWGWMHGPGVWRAFGDTDDAGRIVLRRLPPGAYRVRLRQDGDGGWRHVTVSAGEVTAVTLAP